MSVNFWRLCLDCAVQGPEVGDLGTMGWPSLDTGDVRPVKRNGKKGRRRYAFGRIYAALAAIELLPYEVEAYHAFLVAHQGHRVVEGNDTEGDDEEQDGADMKSTPFVFAGDDLRDGAWSVTCETTGDSFQTEFDQFRPFAARLLAPTEITQFRADASRYIREGVCDKGPLVVDPDEVLAPLVAFFGAHRSGAFRVALIEEVDEMIGESK